MRSLRHSALAALALLSLAVPTASAAPSRSVALRGSTIARHHAVLLRGAGPTATLQISLMLRAANAALLDRLAARSTAARPLSRAQALQLFGPRPAAVAALVRYLRANGLAVRRAPGSFVVSAAGSVAAVQHAFALRLAIFRPLGGGPVFRAPLSSPRLPAALRRSVLAVSGLDSRARPRRASIAPIGRSAVQPIGAGCQSGVAAIAPVTLPAQLASAAGYDYQPLLDAGYDGHGSRIASVQFSDFSTADVAAFQSCFGTSVPVAVHYPLGLAGVTNGAASEPTLDLETMIGAAPGADGVDAYVMPSSGSASIGDAIDAITNDAATTHVNIISISWGLCETLSPYTQLAGDHQAAQIAAVQGISIFAASGDHGANDCVDSYSHANWRSVDDPASLPYVTGVGGTDLQVSGPSSSTESVWNQDGGWAGGGGNSEVWPRPSWQPAVAAVESYAAPCGAATATGCRAVPDIALSASPGMAVYCTVGDCASFPGWIPVGGTSASAPEMSGIAAILNSYLSAHSTPGGATLGFANPFLYWAHAQSAASFRDIILGDNTWSDSINSGLLAGFQTQPGYDRASGLGSVDAAALAPLLVQYANSTDRSILVSAAAQVHIHAIATHLIGTRVLFSGTLTSGDGQPIAGGLVRIDVGNRSRELFSVVARSGADGRWQVRSPITIRERWAWYTHYLGDETHLAAVATGRYVDARPVLTLRPSRTLVALRQQFLLSGRTAPALHGQRATIQYRLPRSTRWRKAVVVTVGARGGYGMRLWLGLRGRWTFRVVFATPPSRRWLGAASALAYTRAG